LNDADTPWKHDLFASTAQTTGSSRGKGPRDPFRQLNSDWRVRITNLEYTVSEKDLKV